MTKRRLAAGFLLAAGLLVVSAAVANARPSHVSGLPNTCSKPFGKGDYVIASDLPLQGSLRPLSVQIVAGDPARAEVDELPDRRQDGPVRRAATTRRPPRARGIRRRAPTTPTPTRASRTCSASSARSTRVAPRSMAPILNRAPGGGIAMVSPANTYVGLTKPTGVAGEPQKYFPTGQAQLRPRRRARQLPGCRRRAVPQGQGRQERLRPERRRGLRRRHREQLRERRQGARHHGARQRQVGREPAELPVAVPGHREQEPRRGLPRRDRLQQRRPADQGQGLRARRQLEGHPDGP